MKQKNNWKGYTLDELRYERLLNMARIEIENERMMHRIKLMYPGGKADNSSTVSAATSLLGSNTGNIVKKMLGALNYFDYALIAFRVGKQIVNTFKRFKRAKD